MARFDKQAQVNKYYQERTRLAKERFKERTGKKIARGFYDSPAWRAINYHWNKNLFDVGTRVTEDDREDYIKAKEYSFANDDGSTVSDDEMYWNGISENGEISNDIRFFGKRNNLFVIVENDIFPEFNGKYSQEDYLNNIQPAMYALLEDLEEKGPNGEDRKIYARAGGAIYQNKKNEAFAVVKIRY